MPSEDLKNKPLVEAILEVKWGLRPGPTPGTGSDPHYPLLLGLFFDRVRSNYPTHEALPTSAVPEEMVPHVVQHRFRSGERKWPLVQLGPGILTVNDTAAYKWSDFSPRCVEAVKKLFDAHPARSELAITNLVLRYIDAVDFDHTKESVFDFLRTKLKTTIALPDALFMDGNVARVSSGFSWQATFPHKTPQGAATVCFATGERSGRPILVWETVVASSEKQIPSMPDGFERWLTEAHNITHDWFFKLIGGDLERQFSGQ